MSFMQPPQMGPITSSSSDNLFRSIKRIIFEKTSKFNGIQRLQINENQIKQIAGRAGRYRTALHPNDISSADDKPNESSQLQPNNVGYVTSLEPKDLPYIHKALKHEAEPITSAGIFPPTNIINQFATYFPPDTPFGYILLRLFEVAHTHRNFHLCGLRELVKIADMIEPVKNLSIRDRIIFCSAPVNTREPRFRKICVAYAKCIAKNQGGKLLDIPELNLDILDQKPTADKEYLSDLEALHRSLILYLWLSYRFEGVFNTQAMALYVKELVEKNIDVALANFSVSSRLRKKLKSSRKSAVGNDLQEISGCMVQDLPKMDIGLPVNSIIAQSEADSLFVRQPVNQMDVQTLCCPEEKPFEVRA